MGSSASAWIAWINLALIIVAPIVLFAFRNWIVARITKGVEHGFNVKLAELEAKLRINEEQLKSGLREKESEIGALRNIALSGSANRQTLLDKRRFEAVEKIWTAVNDSTKLKYFYQLTAALNYNFIALNTHDPRMQQLLTMLDNIGLDVPNMKNVARDERPFVPEIAWAYFNAFSSLLYFNFVRFEVLKLGIKDREKIANTEHMKNILKATLPHQTQYIDEQDAGAYYYLLEEIEAKLLNELRKILEGKEADQSSIQQAKEILSATREAEEAGKPFPTNIVSG
jgi:hypothetical protein